MDNEQSAGIARWFRRVTAVLQSLTEYDRFCRRERDMIGWVVSPCPAAICDIVSSWRVHVAERTARASERLYVLSSVMEQRWRNHSAR